jgi:hypothetical protein
MDPGAPLRYGRDDAAEGGRAFKLIDSPRRLRLKRLMTPATCLARTYYAPSS